MEMLHFEWDPQKDLTNQKKHGISFAEASTVFEDVNALVINDPEHSEDEERFVILGFSLQANLLVVCHCYRASESVIRIISARKATKNESRQYKDEMRKVMKKEYDFSNARKNPYADRVKQQITINLNQTTIQYFKDLAEKTGLPYQTLINLYLTDCAEKKRQPEVNWVPA